MQVAAVVAIVAAIVLAPAAVRLGLGTKDLHERERDARFWREIATQVPADGAALVPFWGYREPCNLELGDVRVLDASDSKKLEREREKEGEERRQRATRRDGTVDEMRALGARYPQEIVSSEDVAKKAREHEEQLFVQQWLVHIGGALALLLALAATIVGAWATKWIISPPAQLPPTDLTRHVRRLAVTAFGGAGIGGRAAVLWALTGVAWLPDYGLLASVAALCACLPLVRMGLRLRRSGIALADDPEVLAVVRVKGQYNLANRGLIQLNAARLAGAAKIDQQQRYLDSLKATAPGSPAVINAEAAVAAAQAAVDAVKVKQAAPADDFAGELHELQTAISEKRKHVAVLRTGGAPPDVIASAEAGIDELRSRFRDLADRAGAGT